MRTRAIVYYRSRLPSPRTDRIWLLASVHNKRAFKYRWIGIRDNQPNVSSLAFAAVVDIADIDYKYIKRWHLVRQRFPDGDNRFYHLRDVEAYLDLKVLDR